MKPFDASGTFHPVAKGDGLRKIAVRGASVTIFSSALSFAIQIAATMVLARLLTPADFGIVTMVTTFSLLLCSFGLNGFTELILQRENLTHSLTSNLFWINLAAGFLLTVMFAAFGPVIAAFYHDAVVKNVVQGMSLTIIASSFSVIHVALLNRAMKFTAVSTNNIVSRLVCVAVSIILALKGWNYWALVAGYVAQPISISIGAWILCRWTPGRPRSGCGTRAAVKFATNVYSHFSLNYFAGNADNLLVGWRFGAQSLGFYKKAFDIFFLPLCQLLSPISAVVVTTLSRLKSERDRYQQYLLAGISVLAFVGMGVGAGFIVVSRDLIRLFLGPGWEETGRIFAFFGPGIGVMLLYYTHGWIHLSIGRPERWFRWGLIEVICTVGLFLIALPWGPKGIALAWTTSFFVLLIPSLWYAGRPIGLGVGPVLTIIWKFFVASVIAVGSTAWLIHMMPQFEAMPGAVGALVRLVSYSLLFATLYLGAVVALHRNLEPVRHAAGLLGDLMPRHSGTRSVAVVSSAAATN